jgi:hypothetical protein
MAISERVNPDNLNIHHFQEIPEGRPELPFDVDRDISQETKDEFLREIENNKVINLIKYASSLVKFKVLWPNVDVPMVPETEIINERNILLKNALRNNAIEIYLSFLCDAKSLGYNLALTEDDRYMIGNNVPAFDKTHNWVQDVVEIKLLDPDIYDKEIESTGHTNIQELKEIEKHFKSKDRFFLLHHYASSMRLLNPDYKPDLNEEEWDKLKEEFKSLIRTNSETLPILELAWQLKILAAHRVEVNKSGAIEVEMYPPADVSDSTPELPEQRKF